MKKKGWVKTIVVLFAMLLVGIAIHEIWYYTRTDQADQAVYSAENAADGSIGVQTGTTMESHCNENYPDAKISSFSAMPDLLQALLSGKVDYVLTTYTACLVYYREYPEQISILPDTIRDVPIAIGLTKGQEELKKKINDRIEQYQNDGTMDEIYSHWLQEDSSTYEPLNVPVLQDAPVLNVAISADDEPMCFVEGGEIIGVDSELIQRIAYDLGMRVEFMNTNFSSVLAAVSSGKVQVAISNMTNTPEREEVMDFTVPYFNNSARFLVRKSEAVQEKTSLAVRLGEDLNYLKGNLKKALLVDNRWKLLVSGLGVTVLISLLAAVFGTLFAALLCFLQMKGNDVVQNLCSILIRIVQGIPILVILMLLYFVVFRTGKVSAVTVAVLAFSVNFGVYVSQMLRAGIQAVDKGQQEAALALGYRPVKAFFRIVLPQAAEHFLPVYKGEMVSLFKSTSIVGYIAIEDLTKMSDIIRSRTYEALFPLLITAAIYFILSYLCAAGISLIQRRCAHGRNTR